MRILHIDSSALGDQSISRKLSAHLATQLQALLPEATYQHLDLDALNMPHWSPVRLTVQDQAMLDDFIQADIVLVGAPMYNFSIPSSLKAWIDRIAVAGKTFRYTDNGPEGLMKDKVVFVLSSRGGVYSEAMQAFDHQETYLQTVFGFLGVQHYHLIRAEGLAQFPEKRESILKQALSHIEQVEDLTRHAVAKAA